MRRRITAGRAALLCLLALLSAPPRGVWAQEPSPGLLRGTVIDPSGSIVTGALVTLQAASTAPRTTLSDPTGAFQFSAVGAGAYTLTISASGFTDWKQANLAVGSGENPVLPPIVLQVAPAASQIDVGLSQKELAVQQVKSEEQQRVLGVFPHYFVTYQSNAAPLTAAQKFQLGWKTFLDPVPVLTSGIGAGVEQARNSYNQFGEGMEGYGKRFGALYADRVNSVLVGHVLLQSAFHQDPRYFYKGNGTVGSRFLYAIATAFVAKGDNGHWQPAYANILGGLASGEISTLYYPASSRTGLRIVHGILLDFGDRAVSNLLEEFVLRKVTSHVPKLAGMAPGPVLAEGTPVTLISVEDLSAKKPENGAAIEFELARDVQAGRLTVIRAGAKAWGRASIAAGRGADGGTHVGLDRVRLTAGKTEVPLRSTPQRGGAGGLDYHNLENSGRIVITLYVAQNLAIAQ